MKRLFPAVLFTVAACAQPFEGQVASRLTQAGLPRPVAECMAKLWVDRLNVAQLQRVSGLADELQRERSRGRLTVGLFVERVRGLDDPEIVEVVTTSTLACALAG